MTEAREKQDVKEKPARLEWIEPEIKVLDISDTKFTDGVGGDTTYEPQYYDVSAS